MDLSLEGKVALVTGGGRGLGRSIVRGLTQAGAHVVVTAACERGNRARRTRSAEGRGRGVPRECIPGFLVLSKIV